MLSAISTFAFPALFNVKPSAWYNPAKWIFPEMADERKRFLEIFTKHSEERMASQEKISGRNDIMSALLAARDPQTATKLTEAEVWGEAHLMIAAGKPLESWYLTRENYLYKQQEATQPPQPSPPSSSTSPASPPHMPASAKFAPYSPPSKPYAKGTSSTPAAISAPA